MLVYLNGKFINEKSANVSVNNRSFRYGDGCFETIKVIHGKPLLIQLHMDRLFASLQFLQYNCPSYFTPAYITQRIGELVMKNQLTNLARIRLTVFRGDGGLYDAVSHHPNLLIQSWPLNPENNNFNENGLVVDFYRNGFKACDAISNVKSNNYLLYALAALAAKQQHCNDMLVLNHHGRIADATIANVWIVEKGKLITPPLSEAPVNGVMRRYILEHAAEVGFEVAEEPLTIERIEKADEVFLTNGIYGLKWVKQLGAATFETAVGAKLHKTLLQPLWV